MSNTSKKSIQTNNLNFFECLNVYIVPNGLGKNRISLFKSSLAKHGANLIEDTAPASIDNFSINCANTISTEFDSDIKCLIVYDETSIKNWPDLEKILFTKKVYSNLKNELDKNAFKRVRCVNSQWVSECLKKKSLISTANYELKPLRKVLSEKKENLFAKSSQAHKRHAQLEESEDDSKRAKTSLTKTDILDILTKSDGSDSEGEFFSASESPDKTKCPLKKPVQTQTFVCAHSSSEQPVNPNKFLTDKLDELGSIYDKTKDRFRALSYQKASAVLKRHPEAVTSYEQAIKLPGIGKNIAEKIAEIAQTGELRKLNNINQREDLSAIKLFTDIHGVGPTTAQQFVNQVRFILIEKRN